MILKFGNYSHAQNEAEVVLTRDEVVGNGGFRTGYKDRWVISGLLEAASQSAMTTAINAMYSAYSIDGQDVGLYLDDGTTLTSHFINSRSTMSGVHVVSGPSFPEGKGAEYSTFRTYSITLEAEYLVPAGQTERGLISWMDMISYQGTGGPRRVIRRPLNGTPIIQTTHQRTPVKIMQRGTAIGRSDYPSPSTPLFPDAQLDPEQQTIDRKSPKRSGPVGRPTYTEWEVTWSYVFEFAVPVAVPVPRLWQS